MDFKEGTGRQWKSYLRVEECSPTGKRTPKWKGSGSQDTQGRHDWGRERETTTTKETNVSEEEVN